ncbi:MAG: hypothetical protein ACN6RJ_08315 [Stenotrophomonas sp.]
MTQARRILTVPVAKSAKMRKGNYIKAQKCAGAVLQEGLHDGKKGFRKALWFGRPAHDRAEDRDHVGRD